MLIFTNRIVSLQPDASAFGQKFRPGSDRLALAMVKRVSKGSWVLAETNDEVEDAVAMHALLPVFQGPKPVLVYLHGNNNTPTKCFERCAKLESLYDVEVVGFSWPSEGYMPDGTDGADGHKAREDGGEDELALVTQQNRTKSVIQSKIWRYHQAKNNAQHSVDALARFLRLVAAARLYANRQPFTLAAHSLGAHYLQYALSVDGATEAVSAAHNVALLAACVRASGHREWLGNVRPKGRLFITYNKADSVLAGARIADGDQIKLGTDPTVDRVRSPYVRYVSFSGGDVGLGGHGYFVNAKMPKKMKRLFDRIFSSEADIREDEFARDVYLLGCDEDRITCYMGAPNAA